MAAGVMSVGFGPNVGMWLSVLQTKILSNNF